MLQINIENQKVLYKGNKSEERYPILKYWHQF